MTKFTIFAALVLAAAAEAAAQAPRERARDRNDPRAHTRLAPGTVVNQAQAEALTLTIGAVAPRLIQTWIRAAGAIDKGNKVLSTTLSAADAADVKVGQRVRAFPPSSKSSMYQAFVTRVLPHDDRVMVDATLSSVGRANTALYVMEIVVEQGPFLSVPNEAIIEEGDRHVVYVQQQPGQYAPKEIQIGRQGELYTEVTGGVKEGDQVVTFGSFFIDAEQKLKGTGEMPPAHTSQ
jgi:membrane fusion protein, copper/silver efflux system